MAKKKRREYKEDPDPELNILNLIDIMFLLLIFLLFQPFKQPDLSLKNELPKDLGYGNSAAKLNLMTRITITPAGPGRVQFMVNSKPAPDPTRISNMVLEASKGDKTVPVAIAPNLQVDWKYCMQVLDECLEAEMSKVSWEAPPLKPGRKLK